MTYREETDSLGSVNVPRDAYYGAQTQRAADNFAISGLKLPRAFIDALALIKQCAARVNAELGLLPQTLAEVIDRAADELLDDNDPGKSPDRLADQFVVDLFQTGSGTSTNMNMNEVLAGRANEMLTGRRGGKDPVHPNDHVNLGQSSNDVIPSAIHVSALVTLAQAFVPAMELLELTLAEKAKQFADIDKIGRTHLQDAVPMTLGQEFSGYARQIRLGIQRVEATFGRLGELALGGTAVGTGLNTHPEFAVRTIALIANQTGLEFCEARNHFEAQAAQDAAVEVSGALKTVAGSLIKIANDVRWLASGPRCGIGEISIPGLQPGSSIMPGKVNPVIPESVIQVGFQVIGNDTTITLAGQSGHFELNVALPLIAHNLLQSISLLSASGRQFAEKCIRGIEADREACSAKIENSLALVTGLVPHIGYDKAAAIAKTAFKEGITVRQAATRASNLAPAVVDQALGPLRR